MTLRLALLYSAFFLTVVYGSCPVGQLSCEDGQCVGSERWCDGNTDCEDSTDEAYCKKAGWWKPDPNNCKGFHFLCEDGICVPLDAKCNVHSDCKDESDEYGCWDSHEEKTSEEDETSEETSEETSDPTVEVEDSFPSTPKMSTAIIRNEVTSPDQDEREDDSVSSVKIPSTQASGSMDFYGRRRQEPSTHEPTTQESLQIDARTTRITDVPRQTNAYTQRSYTPYPTLSSTSYPPRPSYQQSGSTYPPRPSYPQPESTPYPPRPSYPQPGSTYPPRPSYPQPGSTPYPPRPSYPQPGSTPYPLRPPHRQPENTYSQRPPYRRPEPIPYPQRPPHHQPEPTSYPQRPPPRQPGPTPHPQGHRQPESTHLQRPPYHHPEPQRPAYRYPEPTPYPQRPPPRQPEPASYPQRPPHHQPEPTSYPQRPPPRQPEPTSYPQRPPHRQPEPTSYPQRPPPRQPESTYLRRQDPDTLHQRPQPYAPYPQRSSVAHYPSQRQPTNNGQYSENRLAHNQPARTFSGRRKTIPRIYFLKNYTRIYERANEDSVRRGVEWLLKVRDQSGGWGKGTPRALVALSLLNNSFFGGTHENDLMKKNFQVQLGVKLLSPKTLGPNQLAGFVNALLATCQDPRDFHGIDVLGLLRDNQKDHPDSPFVHLTLCLADEDLSTNQQHALVNILRGRLPATERGKDMLSLAISAFACHSQQRVTPSSRDSAYIKSLSDILNNAVETLLQLQMDNGSFGSVYSTALAAQALLSVNDTRGWSPDATFQYLRDQQMGNGSFGDLLATYYALPVLRGRSLLHLRNTLCQNDTHSEDLTPEEILNYVGPKQFIRYSLHFGFPLTNIHSVKVHVPHGISFFDVMRVAELQNSHFNFLYEKKNDTIRVYSISDVPNDWERGLAWRLYVRRNSDTNTPRENEAYTRDIRELFPRSDEHIIFWYHPTGIRL